MIMTTFFLGVVSAIGIFVLLLRLPRRLCQHMLGHHALLDFSFTALMLWMHWGTATGVFAATFAGLCASAAITFARRVLGYRVGKSFTPGWVGE